MPLKIKIGAAAEEKKPIQASIALQITKTMDGNILISDHKYIDIIIDLVEAKIVTMPKPHMEKDVYDYQKDLMYSLFKGGVTSAVAPRGGPVFGMVECTFPAEGEVDNVQAVLYQISEYFKKTAQDEATAEEYDQNIEDRFTDPNDSDSTAYGAVPPYQDTPQGANDSLPTYAYAGYGYYY
jgi:hypothetical protein